MKKTLVKTAAFLGLGLALLSASLTPTLADPSYKDGYAERADQEGDVSQRERHYDKGRYHLYANSESDTSTSRWARVGPENCEEPIVEGGTRHCNPGHVPADWSHINPTDWNTSKGQGE